MRMNLMICYGCFQASDESVGDEVPKSSFGSVASNAIIGLSLRGRLLATRHSTISLEEENEDEIESPHLVSIPDAVAKSSDAVSDPDLRAHARSNQIDSFPPTIEQSPPMVCYQTSGENFCCHDFFYYEN